MELIPISIAGLYSTLRQAVMTCYEKHTHMHAFKSDVSFTPSSRIEYTLRNIKEVNINNIQIKLSDPTSKKTHPRLQRSGFSVA
jgi:hypothetical protein